MAAGAAATIREALRLYGRSWKSLVHADLLYKAITFAILTPLIGLILRWFVSRLHGAAVADVDIALFFFTTKWGATALFVIGALALAVIALENACVMTLGLAVERGARVRVRDAFAQIGKRSYAVIGAALVLVVRLLLIAAPFAAAIGAAYWGLLRAHDINFYLTDKPPEFWAAVAIAGVAGALLVATLLRFVSSWILVFPLVVFERKLTVLAFGESARRMKGRRLRAAAVIVTWAAAALAASWLVTTGAKVAGRSIAPLFGESIAGLLAFVGVVAVAWGLLSLAVNVASTTIYATLVLRLYLEADPKRELWTSVPTGERMELGGQGFTLSFRALGGLLALALVAATGLAYYLLRTAWTERNVLVIAHRGASIEAPENTLAAFKLAGQEGTDYVELDVQETSDGVVVVAHDVDLMKIGGSPLKIWESTFDQLRAVDIGSRVSPKYKDEHLPTLAEALEACKGISHVDIELKDYGHDQRLEERVVDLVETAGMERQIVTMSLSAKMVAKMKQLRPQWTSGLLTAKAIGDLSRLPVDFLAVQSGMATRRFIRAAHAANKPVYVWTIDDPHQMIRMIGLGVDGLITNRPAVAKDLLARFSAMPQHERLFLFVMTRLGAKDEISEDTHGLRP